MSRQSISKSNVHATHLQVPIPVVVGKPGVPSSQVRNANDVKDLGLKDRPPESSRVRNRLLVLSRNRRLPDLL